VSAATGQTELAQFVEAPAAFTAERPGTRIIRSERFTLLADATGRWPMAVQRIRLRADELDDAVEAARSLMRVTGTTAASWWLSEHSTPAGIEEELLVRGMQIVEGDYLIDGMALTREPPAGPADVEARAVASATEFVEAINVQYDSFGTPELRRRNEAEILEEYEQTRGVPRARPRALGRCGRTRDSGARGAGRDDVRAHPAWARLRAGLSVPSDARRSLRGMTAAAPEPVTENCLRCNAAMEWRHATWQCPRCRFKLGCCEGEAGDCRDPG
jgi:hypothetical protein